MRTVLVSSRRCFGRAWCGGRKAMAGKQFLVTALGALVLCVSTADRAAAQNQLLQKFKKQNETAVEKLKADVNANLAEAQSANRDVDKSLGLLTNNLIQLQD